YFPSFKTSTCYKWRKPTHYPRKRHFSRTLFNSDLLAEHEIIQTYQSHSQYFISRRIVQSSLYLHLYGQQPGKDRYYRVDLFPIFLLVWSWDEHPFLRAFSCTKRKVRDHSSYSYSESLIQL